jgi:mRNA-degrading endonuclease RelE of RelBE toxin-antitoxin system
MARMRFEIVLAPSAVQDFQALPAHLRAEVREALERHLRHEPTKQSKSRIKRLRGLRKPQFRLRIGEVRVFYDVTDQSVQVLAVLTKARAQAWLSSEGTPDAGSAAGEDEG